MDMYTERATSIPQKLVVTAIELLMIAASAWVMFGPGGGVVARWFGWSLPADIPVRRYVILLFSLVIFARVLLTTFYLMRRRLGWDEAAGVVSAFGLYYLGFAVLVLPQGAPLGPIDIFAIALFFFGCYLNTGSELGRDRFKKDPANAGKLYTQGLFAWSMHINFFGDVLWVSAYAIIAHTWWAALIPLVTLSFFAFYNAPKLDSHLAAHYGAQFEAYARRTKRLIPLVW